MRALMRGLGRRPQSCSHACGRAHLTSRSFFERRRLVAHEGNLREHLGRARDRKPHALQQRRHAGDIDAVGDFQRRELRVLDHARHEVLEPEVVLRIHRAAAPAMGLRNAFLKPPPRRLGRLAVGQVREQQHEPEHAIGRGLHGVGAHQQRANFAIGAAQARLAAPGLLVQAHHAQLAGKRVGVDEMRGQIPCRYCGRSRSPSSATKARWPPGSAPSAIGDDHGLIGGADLPQDLVELILRDHDLHGAELHDDVGDARADHPRRREIGGRPGIGRALDDLMPLRERAARRQFARDRRRSKAT